MDEFELIARFLAPLAGPGGLGLLDDGAVVPVPPDHDLVVTTDAVVAGVHYLADDGGAGAAKVLRVNLSDLAAMGAAPLAYTLTLALPFGALPSGVDEAWMTAFCDVLKADQEMFGISLVGGDTVATPGPALISVTAFGTVVTGRCLRRSGGRAGDDVWVSGTIGDAVLGLGLLQGSIDGAGLDAGGRAGLIARHRRPTPRLDLGLALGKMPKPGERASAVLDVSDGLYDDLGKLCAASHVGAEISLELIPLSDFARTLVRNNQELLCSLLGGGDDYELVFTAAPDAAATVIEIGTETGVSVTRIGRLIPGSGVRVLADGMPIEVSDGGYRHF